MTAPGREWREISNSQFGDNAFVNQGNFHVHLPLPPAPAKVIRAIPYHLNEDLVCRKDVVDQLDNLLPPTPGFYSAALWGLGGSGKTQIALDYAYRRCSDDECCVFWVHADSEATFTSDYKAIGKKLGVGDESLNGSELLDAVRSGIEARSRWVLILDNADDLGLFGVGRTEESLAKYIPRGPQGTILWTSRDARIVGTLVGPSRGIEVSSMTKDEATSLLVVSMSEKIKSGAEETEMDRLLEELQRLPLAVSQAGVYMRRTRTPIKEYLNLLLQGTSRWDLLNMTDSDRHRRPEVPNSVLETWKISIKRIQEESELSYRILHVIAYLDSQDIPHELMLAAGQGSASNEDGDDGRRDTELKVLQAVTRLVEFSFLQSRRVEEGRRSYEMHKLVQEAVRYGLSIQGPREAALGKTTTGEDIAKNTEVYFSCIALQIVDDAFQDTPWPRRYHYISHAIQMGEWAEVSGKEVEASALLHRISNYMFSHGRWREKEPVDRKIIYLRVKALGEKHPDTIKGMALLVTTQLNQGRYSEGEELAEQVLKLQQQEITLGEKHPDTLSTMADLAAIYQGQARYSEAEKLTQQILNLRREVLGEDDPHTIGSMENLGTIYYNQGRRNEAERLIEQTLNKRQEILGEKHPDTIRSISHLAITFNDQGRYDDAERLKKQALTLYQEVLGKRHPDTVRTMGQLAETYDQQGRHDESERLKEQVLSLQLEDLGKKHPDTIRTMGQLASTYHRQKRYAEAERLKKQVLNYQREVLGEKHQNTARTMASLSATYISQGRRLDAQTMLTEARVIQGETLGEKHPDTIASRSNLGVLLYLDGRYNEAKWVFITVQDLQTEVFGEKHPDTLMTMARLAQCWRHIEPSEAKKILVELLRLYREVYGDEHFYTIKTAKDLAACEDQIQSRDDGRMQQQQQQQQEDDNEQTPSRDDESRWKLDRRALREAVHDKLKIFKRRALG
ncbi:hypothetical protein ACHAQJ_009411 [Trichoderma viride]